MSAGEIAYVALVLLATVVIPALPSLLSLRGAGPRYRAATLRFLGAGFGIVALVAAWVLLGGYALTAGPRWWNPYRDLTLVLMGVWFALLPFGIRAGNRALRAAHEADRATVTGPAQ